MRISLTDSTGETFIYEVDIEWHRSLSLDGPLYMMTRYTRAAAITWQQWQEGNGTVIYGDESELKRFERWAQYGRDQAAKARKRQRKSA